MCKSNNSKEHTLTSMASDKVEGTVKWFSNRKGYGFITPVPGSSTSEDIFVHQSTIHSDGYRTLGEGWTVEFEIGHDDDGKIKAENVTAVGGGACTGPRNPRRRRNFGDGGEMDVGEEMRSPRDRTQGKREPQPIWHDSLSDEVKLALRNKNIRTSTGTIDVALGSARIKLGTRGYSSMAHADGILVEGSFTCSDSGDVTFEWKRALEFDAEWKPLDNLGGLVSYISLSDDAVGAVGVDEDMASLMGDAPTDPRTFLEENGFEMRRVVLTAKRK